MKKNKQKKSEQIINREEGKHVRLTRADIIALLKHHIRKPPPDAKFVVVEVEQGDDFINVNEVDALVISWG